MQRADFLREISDSLLRDRLRAGLTTAGIAVGCFSVAVLLSLGAAIKGAIGSSMKELGENLVVVLPERAKGGPLGNAVAASAELSEADAAALRRLPGVRQVSAFVTARAVAAVDLESATTTCIGIDRFYMAVAKVEIDAGDDFRDEADHSAQPVAILGASVQRRLFPDGDAVGRMLSVAGRRLRVVGIARERGQGMGGLDQDDFVLVPKAFARQQLIARPAAATVDAIFVLATEGAVVDDTVADVYDVLGRTRHVTEIRDAISVNSLKGLMAASLQASDLLTVLMGGMASVSLLVGGVGIVNVMLANLADRRMEIGLKLALGAAPAAIGLEFFVEAVVLALAGAVIGLVGAELLAIALDASGVLSIAITGTALLLSTGLAVGVGMVAGAYPAARAAQLDPREILRDA